MSDKLRAYFLVIGAVLLMYAITQAGPCMGLQGWETINQEQGR